MSIIRLEALVLAALAAGASALPAVAQVPVSQAPATGSQYSFYMLRGHDTIIVERVARGPRALVGEFKDPTGSLIRYTVQLDDSALIAHAMLSATPRGASPQVYDFAFVQDTLLITQPARDAATGTPPVRIHAVHGTLLQENPSVAFVEQMLMRARLIGGTATTQVPLLFTLGAAQVTATVAWIGADSATATINGTQMRLAVRNDGSIMGGTIPSQGIVIVRGPGGAPLVSGPAPDYSAPPGAPYTAENVVVHTPQGLRLAGTLTLPAGASASHRVPGVVTITGSGPEDRNSESPALHGWKPFAQIADTLSRRGMAVLRLDDRGVGGSDAAPDSPTGIASDMSAAVAYLRSRPEIDPRRIALLGHSEGGLVAPMVASTDSGIKAVVLMAAPGEPVLALLKFQQAFAIDSMAHLTGDARAAAFAQAKSATDSLVAYSAGFAELVNRDPAPLLRMLRQPVLILQGEKDYQVPRSQAEKVAALIRANGNRDVTVRYFAGLNHLFVPGLDKGYDYNALPSLAVPAVVLGTVADWLAARLR